MSSDEIRIREALADDRQAVAAIAQEVVDDGRVFVFEAVSDAIDYWYSPGGHVFVAVRDGETLGTYVVKPNQKGRGAHVANVGYMVRKSARGLCVGTAMGAHSLDAARALGFRAIQFNMVVATNAGAIRVWEKLGFETAGRLPGVFRHPELGYVDALVMFRTL